MEETKAAGKLEIIKVGENTLLGTFGDPEDYKFAHLGGQDHICWQFDQYGRGRGGEAVNAGRPPRFPVFPDEREALGYSPQILCRLNVSLSQGGLGGEVNKSG